MVWIEKDEDYINDEYFDWNPRNEELFKRVYDREEIIEDGIVVHVNMKGHSTQINEYAVEKVGPEQIRFQEPAIIKGRKKKSIPHSSIGYAYKPEIKNYEIYIEGLCLSKDKELLVKTMVKVANQESQKMVRIIEKQVKNFKLAYKAFEENKAALEKEMQDPEVLALETEEVPQG